MRFTRGSSTSLISESQTEEITEDNRETEESETESISAGSEGPKPKQLCVIEGLGINAIAQALAAAKALLVKHFHHSARATEELRKKQESMNQPTHKLVNECKTRWNSTFYMCRSLLQNRWPVSAVIADESVTRVEHRRLGLSNAQWELLGDLVKILHPLEIGTTHLCSESTSSISSILPVLFGILRHLEVKEGDLN